MTKPCVNCGHELHAKATVCPQCGQGNPADSPAKPEHLVPKLYEDHVTSKFKTWLDSNLFLSGSSADLAKITSAAGLSGVSSPFGSFSDAPEVQTLKNRILDLQTEVSRQAHHIKTETVDKHQKDAQLQKHHASL